jgi:hypothetical protein
MSIDDGQPVKHAATHAMHRAVRVVRRAPLELMNYTDSNVPGECNRRTR